MNWLKKITLAMVLLPATAHAEDWHDAVKGWNEAVSRSIAGTGTAQEVEAAGRILQDWHRRQAPGFQWENEQQRASLDLVDFKISQAWAREGDYGKALSYLQQEAAASAAAGGRLLDNTRNPAAFASEVFALHSEIMAHTGGAAVIPDAGYEVFAASADDTGHAYVFVYEPSQADEGGVAIEGMAEDEQRLMIELYAPSKEQRYHMSGHAQVVGKKGGMKAAMEASFGSAVLTLDGVTKVVEYQAELEIPRVRPSASERVVIDITGQKLGSPVEASTNRAGGASSGVGPVPSTLSPQAPASGDGAGGMALAGKSPSTATLALVAGTLGLVLVCLWWFRKQRK